MTRVILNMPIFLIGILLVAVGCGSTETATPTLAIATQFAPSPTTVATIAPVSAATAAGPTSQATVAGGGGGGAGIFGTALEKAKTATVYRVEMQMSVRGAFGAISDETPTPGALQDLPIFALTGDVREKDSHVKMQGFMAAFLGVDPAKGLEIISLGDKSFVHGPVPLLGAAEDKWYQAPAQTASSVKPPLTSQSFLEGFNQSGLNPTDVQKTGSELFDNQLCDVYAASKDALGKAFQDIGQQSGTSESNQVIDTGELKFWVCADGYLHQVRLSVEGHSKDKPDQKGSFLVTMHLFDINSPSIKIEAPANAEPLSAPSFLNLGTPTP